MMDMDALAMTMNRRFVPRRQKQMGDDLRLNRVGIRVSAGEHEELRTAAAREGKTVADFLRGLVEDELVRLRDMDKGGKTGA